ncbi:hypothetical protein ACFE04_021826 [Oxalis oulophora]
MGSAYTTIAADAIARFQRLLGKKVNFVTGTDEHGEKIATAATTYNSSPSEHCDTISQSYKSLWKDLDISYDKFIQTTDPKHEVIVYLPIKSVNTRLSRRHFSFYNHTSIKGKLCISTQQDAEILFPSIHQDGRLAASSLNIIILQSDSTVFTWSGNLTSTVDEELMERMLDLIKPNLQTKSHKEGYESEQFWELLGGKTEYASNKIAKEAETEPHLFACSFSNEDLKVTEIYSFTQDDLMTEDIFILSCHRELFVWIGKQVDTKNRTHALAIGEKISLVAPVYVIMEGSEP